MIIKEPYEWAVMNKIENHKLEIDWLESEPNYHPDLLDIRISFDSVVIVLP